MKSPSERAKPRTLRLRDRGEADWVTREESDANLILIVSRERERLCDKLSKLKDPWLKDYVSDDEYSVLGSSYANYNANDPRAMTSDLHEAAQFSTISQLPRELARKHTYARMLVFASFDTPYYAYRAKKCIINDGSKPSLTLVTVQCCIT